MDIVIALTAFLMLGTAVGWVIGFAAGRDYQADFDDAYIASLEVSRRARHVTRIDTQGDIT